VVADVLLLDRLADEAVGGADGVVRRDTGARVVEPVYGARPGALGDVEDDLVYGVGAGAAGNGVVAMISPVPPGAGIIWSRKPLI
jgi:hypothetical protein